MRVTAFVTTVGARTFEACVKRLHGQPCIVDVIENVSPWAAAANEMLRRCTTELFVQVDEDMILRSDAVARLASLIDAAPSNVCMATMPLWDVEVEMPIYGVKIYRHALVRDIPFEHHVLGDARDRETWAARGLATTKAPLVRDNCIGKHGTFYTPEQAFRRWRSLWQRHRRTGKLAWIEPFMVTLGERYRESCSRRDLFAWLGAVIGSTEQLWPDDAGPDASRKDDALERLRARFP